MKIHDNHLYHGAALIQIAEHSQFTAINSLTFKGVKMENGYEINNGIPVLLKYCMKPISKFNHYQFGFTQGNIDLLRAIKIHHGNLYLGLVCVKDREICCLSFLKLNGMLNYRIKAAGNGESHYTVYVSIPKNKSMRVYISAPGSKTTIVSKPWLINRKDFPNVIFT